MTIPARIADGSAGSATAGAFLHRYSHQMLAHAVLDAGGTETVYARLGTGRTLVLLQGEAAVPDAGPSPLLLALASRFRVIAPWRPTSRGAPATQAAFDGWLRDFLDGIGADAASLVADGDLVLPTLHFAAGDPTRAARTALLLREPADPARPTGVPVELLDCSEGRLLVRWTIPHGDGAAVEVGAAEVARLLAERWVPAA
jgi:hypothetical protein